MSITSVKSGATGISLALDNNFMEPIATTLVGSGGVNTVIFNDIPQNYKHLQLRGIARCGRAVAFKTSIYARFNSDTSTANYYEFHYIYGDGTTAGAGAFDGGTVGGTYVGAALGTNAAANCFNANICDILDYSSSSKNKTVRTLSGAEQNSGNTNSEMTYGSGLWLSTDPITSITLIEYTGSLFSQYSRFSLYGIKG